MISERENALYVDLVDSEGRLEWWSVSDDLMSHSATRSMHLVQALRDAQVVCAEGCAALRQAWSDFDPFADTHYQDWAERTTTALEMLSTTIQPNEGWGQAAARVVQLWPMPMVELDVEEVKVSPTALQEERARAEERFLREKYGSPER